MRIDRRCATLLLATSLGLAGLGAGGAGHAQSLKPGETLSSITIRTVSAPDPVTGADGRIHLAYELLVVNPSRLFVTLERVEAVDAAGRSLSSVEGDALRAMTTLFSGGGPSLSPGESAVVFMDVSFAAGEALPERIAARVAISRQAVGPDRKPVPLPADAPLPAKVSFTGGETRIGPKAVVVEPPLRGPGWVAVNGCCDSVTSHRGAVMAVNGVLRVPERFAIDWIQLDPSRRVFTGDPARLSSYAYYGVPVYAAASGVVVNRYDAADEQVPGGEARGITPENIGGNMLVVDIGGGAYAFYAHLQRGSLKVKLGDRVTAGQAIALLGNTGNSTAPHLHFHVMDGPSPLDANGLPFAFTRFRSEGVMADSGGDDDPVEKGAPAKIDTTRLGGEHVDQLPLNNEVVDFD